MDKISTSIVIGYIKKKKDQKSITKTKCTETDEGIATPYYTWWVCYIQVQESSVDEHDLEIYERSNIVLALYKTRKPYYWKHNKTLT